jgi:multiple sugar transport system substrate-binding protein
MPGANSATWGQAHMHSIAANTKNLDAAWALLVFLGSETYQIDLIKEGLWMPNRTSLYTPEGIKRWLTGNHPDGFATYATYFRDFAKIAPFSVMGNEAQSIFVEELESYYKGDANLDIVIANMRKRIDAVYAK